ncbi:hypothetical protein V8C40DRAFT_247770 [Trichoderma camerunense]
MQGTMQAAPKGPPRMDWISTNLQVTRFDMGSGLERNLPSASLTHFLHSLTHSFSSSISFSFSSSPCILHTHLQTNTRINAQTHKHITIPSSSHTKIHATHRIKPLDPPYPKIKPPTTKSPTTYFRYLATLLQLPQSHMYLPHPSHVHPEPNQS